MLGKLECVHLLLDVEAVPVLSLLRILIIVTSAFFAFSCQVIFLSTAHKRNINFIMNLTKNIHPYSVSYLLRCVPDSEVIIYAWLCVAIG